MQIVPPRFYQQTDSLLWDPGIDIPRKAEECDPLKLENILQSFLKTTPVCQSKGTVPQPPSNVEEACQPRGMSPNKIKSFQKLRGNHSHPWSLITEEFFEYFSDLSQRDG